MALNHRNEILRLVAGERRFAKVRVGGEIVFRSGVEVGKVAAATTGDENLGADAVTTLQHDDGTSALARNDSAHQTGRTGTDHHHVGHEIRISLAAGKGSDEARWRSQITNRSDSV